MVNEGYLSITLQTKTRERETNAERLHRAVTNNYNLTFFYQFTQEQ